MISLRCARSAESTCPTGIASTLELHQYSIGHNIGATVFTGGAIRFRIYSDYGLSAVDVAKICFLSGLTFWLGNTFVLGIAWPGILGGFRDGPAAALGQSADRAWRNRRHRRYFVWLTLGEKRPRARANAWKVTLPSAPLTLVQILIGVVDLASARWRCIC